jgi:hypothetical protein
MFVAGLLWAAEAQATTAQQAQPLEIPRIEGSIRIDGRPDDPAWAAVPLLPMTMFEPEFGAPISRASEVRIAHDGRFLYALGVFHDDGPVRANSRIRDHYAEDDFFNLVIDGFNDQDTALWFLVTPLGTRQDGAIVDDAEGDRWNLPELDNSWDAAAVITAHGWSAEMRIPLSSLRFQEEDGEVRMGLIVGRMIMRLRERHTFPAIRPGRNVAQFKPSLAAPVVLRGVTASRPVELRPYGLSGFSRTRLGEVAPEDRIVRELGADLKVGLGSRLTLDLTVNTDFAQTEADDERLNLTRFNLFFAEKRQFFLERAGVFDFGDPRDHRLFYSRRLGLAPDGTTRRVYAGGRLTGRVGAWEIGVLDMQTEAADGGMRNDAVSRVRHRVLNRSSHIGAILTTSVQSGEVAAAGGVDGTLNLAGSHYLTYSAAVSEVPGVGRGHALHVTLEDRDRRGFSYHARATSMDSTYTPPLGFVFRPGASSLGGGASYGRFGLPGRLQQQVVSARTTMHWRQGGAGVETVISDLSWQAIRRGGGSVFMGIRGTREDLAAGFALSPSVEVPAGRYDFLDGQLIIGTPGGRAWRSIMSLTGGKYFDGHRIGLGFDQVWNVSPIIELGATLEADRVRFAGREEHLSSEIVRLRARIAPTIRLSLHALGQYNSGVGRAAANVRLRYNFREGQDFYLVWNEGAIRQAAEGDVERWSSARRGLLVKYGHSLSW